ncbi:putative DNA-binding transcriptional regulator YafY [Acinetobacter calcoaceticus]|uniref:Putative DNA-binding transcriptional regulator YafY n=1 Tax=Acinetobacter calcoaceticus TaxID=471 RepID=A0A4R1XRZ7_ACICA|nr:putative DNA-binding transcriptional regulator YafY [Acinetobacter calcoaceticus]
MKTQRLLKIMHILSLRRTPISAAQLAADLEVSMRTIYRDMQDLITTGLPIEGEAGMGYQLGKGYFLPAFHFDVDEVDSILIGLQLIQSIVENKTLSLAAQRVLSKIALAMQSQDQHYVLNSPFKSVSHKMDAFGSNAYFDQLRQAIRQNRYIHLVYLDLKQQTSLRTVRPLGLTFFDEVWLLTAWCEVKHDFRNFRLDRIQECNLLKQQFLNDPHKSFEDYLKTL